VTSIFPFLAAVSAFWPDFFCWPQREVNKKPNNRLENICNTIHNMAGKIDKSQWEKNSAPAAPGVSVPAGAKGKASMFEQAAKDAAPKKVEKKVFVMLLFLRLDEVLTMNFQLF
jgi:hypothetical protein